MLSVLQICLLSVIGILAVASIVFTVLFIIEISVREKKTVKKVSIKKVIEENKKKEEELQISVDEMLENLEKQTKEENQAVEDVVVELVNNEVSDEDKVSEEVAVENESVAVDEAEKFVEEIKSEAEAEEVKEEAEEVQNETVEVVEEAKADDETNEAEADEIKEETEAEEVQNETLEVVEEAKADDETIVGETTEETVVIEEVAEEKMPQEEITIEELADIPEDDAEDEDEDGDEDGVLTYEKLEPEIILAPGTVIDYKARLEKLIASKSNLERDLAKIQKFILKYERTGRRKERNQKMLDRRAGELTNLNLVMYSVTDIKNVDEEKKVKQEELTAHIAELKASIQDAEEYLDSNKEKYNHNVKMAKFLTQERTRFAEEIVELQALIKAADENK